MPFSNKLFLTVLVFYPRDYACENHLFFNNNDTPKEHSIT